MSALDLTLLYLLAGVVGVTAFRFFKLPAILGYLLVGVIIGPHAFNLSTESAGVAYLAEFGVVFLMFLIGLEFNLPKLKSMQRLVFGLGMGQVFITIAGAVAGHLVLMLLFGFLGQAWDLSWQGAFALGGALAMSSTAIVARLMAERLELDSEHGKHVMGVLLFQDLAVVPLLVLIPALAQPMGPDLWQGLGLALLKAVVLVGLLLAGGQRILRQWLWVVARRKSDELFMLNLLLLTLGLAWLTEHAGLSLALGAFIAGMLISETEFKHRVEADVKPFQDVLLGLFFITIGMKLNWLVVWEHWALVIVFALFPVVLKGLVIVGLARAFGASSGVAMRTGLYLAQAGEFGFVLLTLIERNGLVSPQWVSPILAAMVLSMLATPFIIQHADRLVMRVSVNDWLLQSVMLTRIATATMRQDHAVIVCGFGRHGQNLAALLEEQGLAYVALDLDPERIRQASVAGHSVVLGDAARLPSLMAAGLAHASAVVITYDHIESALQVISLVHEHAPQVPVVARARDELDMDRLRQAGAAEVVPEALEGSLMLASHALALVGVPMRRVIRIIQQQRHARYQLLRGFFHGHDDDGAEDIHHERLQTLVIPAGAKISGLSWEGLMQDLPALRLVQWRRGNGRSVDLDESARLEGGDVLVVSGLAEDLALLSRRIDEA